MKYFFFFFKRSLLYRLSADYITTEDTATSSNDYFHQSSSLRFQQDEITAVIDIRIRNDNVYEDAEQFFVTLQSDLPGQIASRNSAIVNIENDDGERNCYFLSCVFTI